MSYEPPTEEEMRRVRRKDGRRGGCGSPCCSEDSATHVHCGDPCSMAITHLRWKRAGSPRAIADGVPDPRSYRASTPPRLGSLGDAPSGTWLAIGGAVAFGVGLVLYFGGSR